MLDQLTTMFPGIKTKTFWVMAGIAAMGAASIAYPPAGVVLTALGLPVGATSLQIGIGGMLGRDTIQRIIAAMEKS